MNQCEDENPSPGESSEETQEEQTDDEMTSLLFQIQLQDIGETLLKEFLLSSFKTSLICSQKYCLTKEGFLICNKLFQKGILSCNKDFQGEDKYQKIHCKEAGDFSIESIPDSDEIEVNFSVNFLLLTCKLCSKNENMEVDSCGNSGRNFTRLLDTSVQMPLPTFTIMSRDKNIEFLYQIWEKIFTTKVKYLITEVKGATGEMLMLDIDCNKPLNPSEPISNKPSHEADPKINLKNLKAPESKNSNDLPKENDKL